MAAAILCCGFALGGHFILDWLAEVKTESECEYSAPFHRQARVDVTLLSVLHKLAPMAQVVNCVDTSPALWLDEKLDLRDLHLRHRLVISQTGYTYVSARLGMKDLELKPGQTILSPRKTTEERPQVVRSRSSWVCYGSI